MTDSYITYSQETDRVLAKIKNLTGDEVRALAASYESDVGSGDYRRWGLLLKRTTGILKLRGANLLRESARLWWENGSTKIAVDSDFEFYAGEEVSTAAVIATEARTHLSEAEYCILIGPWRKAIGLNSATRED